MKRSNKPWFVALAAMILLSAGIFASCSTQGGFALPEETARPVDTTAVHSTPQEGNHLEVVYFHRASRCYGCIYAEEGIRYTIRNFFAEDLASGRLVFRVVDVQDGSNSEIVGRYGAYTSSLYINEVKDGVDHIHHITSIWYRLGDDWAFVDAVRAEIQEHLENI